MRRERTTDPSLVAGVVLASAVFATAIVALTGFAALVAEPPSRLDVLPSTVQSVEGATGFTIRTETYAGTLAPWWTLVYENVYENLGEITATVEISATLPGGAFYSRAWWSSGPDAGQDLPPPTMGPGGQLMWQLPGPPGGVARSFQVEVLLDQVQPGAQITYCAEVGRGPDETTEEDNFDCTSDVVHDESPNLAVTKGHEWLTPDYSKLGYEIRVWNWGTAAFEAVLLTDTLPVGTSLNLEDFDSNLDVEVLGSTDQAVTFVIPVLELGVTGWIRLGATVDEPAVTRQILTNTVEIKTPQGEVTPDDNSYLDVTVTPAEVHELDIHVGTDLSRLWVATPLVASGPVTVTMGVTTTHVALIGPDCRCAEFPDIGPVYPGNLILVEAGAASQPVTITVPTPFEATAASENDIVYGQIDMLDWEPIEVALYGGPVRVVRATMGGFGADFPDVPRGAIGEVRYRTQVDFTHVTFRRRFYTRDLVFNVHLRDDWINGYFEAGYPLEIAVTEAYTGTIKGTAEVETGFPPWWEGASGFTTELGDPWSPARPDIQPGDWVYGSIYPLEIIDESLRVGQITGTVDVDADTVHGVVSAPWLPNPVQGGCVVAQEGAPTIEFVVNPSGGEYLCDFGASGRDLNSGDQVLVYYRQDDGHRVMNQFPLLPPLLGVTTQGLGSPAGGSNFEYVVALWNEGGQAAVGTVVTDTLPVGASFLGHTAVYTPTVIGSTVVFDVGTLEPGPPLEFSLFAHVPFTATATITNTVEIGAVNVLTPTVAGPAVWGSVVQPSNTDLSVTANPHVALPEPGSELVWTVNVCNVGTTSSATAVFTTTLSPSNPRMAWIAEDAGWAEIAATSELLAATRPTVPDAHCSTHYLITDVSPNAIPGEHLCLTAEVLADADVDPNNDVTVVCAYVVGSAPAIDIEKTTNGQDADAPPGPSIVVGQPVEWVYEVANTGNVTLTAVTVEDDQPGVTPVCPGDVLAPGQIMTCTAAGVAIAGQYANIGIASATPPLPAQVSDSDPSHYLGVLPDVIFEDDFESGNTAAWSRDHP